MEKINDVVIIGYDKVTEEGIELILNKKTKLITGNIKCEKFWVSWDKIGKSLFEGYREHSYKI